MPGQKKQELKEKRVLIEKLINAGHRSLDIEKIAKTSDTFIARVRGEMAWKEKTATAVARAITNTRKDCAPIHVFMDALVRAECQCRYLPTSCHPCRARRVALRPKEAHVTTLTQTIESDGGTGEYPSHCQE